MPEADPTRRMAEQVADATGIPHRMLGGDPAAGSHAAATAAAAGEGLRCLDAGRGGHTCAGPVEYREALTATGASFPRCHSAWSAALDHRDRVRADYPDSPVPPAWFTRQGGEAFAGEKWDEDD